MANLQIKGMDDELYTSLKELASSENRSISQQVVFLLKQYLGRKHQIQKIKTPAQVLLELAGSWEDARSSENIIKEMEGNKINKKRRRFRAGVYTNNIWYWKSYF